MNQTGLKDSEKYDLYHVLQHVKTINDVPLETKRGKGRFMAPGVYHDFEVLELKPIAARSILWICLPYFSLEKRSQIHLADGDPSHPSWGLLQYRFRSFEIKGDEDQAVCKVGNTGKEKDDYFHISQFWCVVFNNSESQQQLLTEWE